MTYKAAMPFVERAERHRLAVSHYQRGLSSREVAPLVGLSDSHVRYVLRLYGVARRRGRPG